MGPNDPIGNITREQANYLFKNDVNRSIVDAQMIFGNQWNTLDQARKDVIVNMLFNLGRTKFLGFKETIKNIKSNNWEMAAKEMLDSDWRSQVKGRSYELADIMRGRQLSPNESWMNPTPQSTAPQPTPPRQSFVQPPQTNQMSQVGHIDQKQTNVGEIYKKYDPGKRATLTPDEQKKLEEQAKTATTPEEFDEMRTAYPETMGIVMQNPQSRLAKAMMNPHTNHLLAGVFAEYGDEFASEFARVYNSLG